MIKLEISTHTSGDNDIVEVDQYDAQQVASQINDDSMHAIALGSNVYSRIDIKNIKPVSAE